MTSDDLVKKMARQNARKDAMIFNKELFELLNCARNTHNRYIPGHLKNLLIKNDDLKRLKTLARLFRVVGKFSNGDTLKNFYTWYKFNPISKEDYKIYRLYCSICKEVGINGDIIPTAFSQASQNLKSRILNWLDGGGNSINEVLCDYFFIVVSTCFKKSLIYDPRSLLGVYGWGLFMGRIRDEFGDEKNYIKPSKKKIEIAKTTTNKLLKINSLKNKLMQKNMTDLANLLDSDLHKNGIDHTYKIYIALKAE